MQDSDSDSDAQDLVLVLDSVAQDSVLVLDWEGVDLTTTRFKTSMMLSALSCIFIKLF